MTGSTVLMMIDMQNMYLEQEKRDVYHWPPIWRFDEVVSECRELLTAARAQGMPVIYTRAVNRPDGVDAMPSWKKLRQLSAGDQETVVATTNADWSGQIIDELAPEPGDIVLDKLRWCSFHFTELENILRNLGAERLIIAGLQTNACIETTARSALMRNFEVAVPLDAVSTDGEDLHWHALRSMMVLYVEVAPWRELLDASLPWDRAFAPGYGRLPFPQESSALTAAAAVEF